jgi:rRNA maturation RNase YbeY
MITINNRTRRPKISQQNIKKIVQKILDILHYSDYDIGILLTTNKSIQVYNRSYRNKDKPTDILSFSYHPDLKPGKRIKPKSEEDKNLGDLIISLEYVQKDAKNLGQTLNERMKILLVHGICHLLGYDHEKDSDWKVMQKKENEILKQLKNL